VKVIDPDHIQPVYADLVTELRVMNGVLCLSLATVVIDGDDAGIERSARVCARLRIAPSTLQYIQQVLTQPDQTQVPSGQTLN
ncbi:MAG: hypothetical protein KGL39_44190, partial [Patescibacteria group bacterium]|nr:hypothetical protein [Patescibacteria group bacterium]